MGIRGDSWGFMGIRGISWDFVGFRGVSWDFVGIRGDSWGFVRNHGDSWGFVGLREKSWGFVGIREKSWGFVGIREKSWGFVEIHANPWDVVGCRGMSWDFVGFRGIPWEFVGILGIRGISWDFVGFHAISWDSMRFRGISWEFVGFRGNSWEFMGMPGNFRVFPKKNARESSAIFKNEILCGGRKILWDRCGDCVPRTYTRRPIFFAVCAQIPYVPFAAAAPGGENGFPPLPPSAALAKPFPGGENGPGGPQRVEEDPGGAIDPPRVPVRGRTTFGLLGSSTLDANQCICFCVRNSCACVYYNLYLCVWGPSCPLLVTCTVTPCHVCTVDHDV